MTEMGYWLVFLGAALALTLAPGPDMLYVLSRTLAHGRRVGFASSLGVCSGALVHVVAAAFGLSALLATSATAFSLVKWIGAAVLLWFGLQALRAPGALTDLRAGAATVPAVSSGQAFRQGVLVDLFNPKVALFFMAFLPQFVRPEHGAVTWQLLGLGALVIALGILVDFGVVLLGARLASVLRRRQGLGRWLERGFAGVLIGLGVRLALSERA